MRAVPQVTTSSARRLLRDGMIPKEGQRECSLPGLHEGSGILGQERPHVDGCRESEVSPRVIDRRFGLMALQGVQCP